MQQNRSFATLIFAVVLGLGALLVYSMTGLAVSAATFAIGVIALAIGLENQEVINGMKVGADQDGSPIPSRI
jgi:uncharacterized membrane protein YczE